VSGSGISWAICKSVPRSRQITTPALHYSSFLQAGCPSCRPTNDFKALKASTESMPKFTHISLYKSFDIAPNILRTILTRRHLSTILQTVDSQFVTVSVQICRQHDAREAARRAGPSATAGTRVYSTQLNSTENYGRKCLTPLSPHHIYIQS